MYRFYLEGGTLSSSIACSDDDLTDRIKIVRAIRKEWSSMAPLLAVARHTYSDAEIHALLRGFADRWARDVPSTSYVMRPVRSSRPRRFEAQEDE